MSATGGNCDQLEAALRREIPPPDAYEARYAGITDQIARRLAELAPSDADPSEVARQIARVIDLPKGQRPFRVHIDPADDGATEVNALGDRVRERFYHRIGLEDLLHPDLITSDRPATA